MEAQDIWTALIVIVGLIVFFRNMTSKSRQRKAMRKLAQENSLETIRTLAEKITQSDDKESQQIALDALVQQTQPEAIGIVCEVWADSRHPKLETFITELGWVATQPIDLRILSALKGKQWQILLATDVDAVTLDYILAAHEDRDADIAQNAEFALKSLLQKAAVIDKLWSLMLYKNHPLASELVSTQQLIT